MVGELEQNLRWPSACWEAILYPALVPAAARVPNPDPVLDQDRALMGPEIPIGALWRQVDLQGVFVKIGDSIKFKGFLVDFLQNRRSSENQNFPYFPGEAKIDFFREARKRPSPRHANSQHKPCLYGLNQTPGFIEISNRILPVRGAV